MYELWSIPGGTAIGDFPTEGEALAAVRREIEMHGQAYADGVFLGYEDDRGRSVLIATGARLVEMSLSPSKMRRAAG